MVIVCFRLSGSLRSSGNQRTIGVATVGMSFRAIAIPTSVEMMLFEADLMLARRFGPYFGA